jgi:WXG100 family type VII secretion target
MSGIKVTPEQLQALAGQVGRGAGDIEAQLRALASTVAPLAGGDWAGHAQQRFTALWDEWQRSAQGLQHALDGIGQLMQQAGSAYAQAEQQIAGSFR